MPNQAYARPIEYQRRNAAFEKYLKQQPETLTTEAWIKVEHAFAYGSERGREDMAEDIEAALKAVGLLKSS